MGAGQYKSRKKFCTSVASGVEGDKVLVRLAIHATHRGPFGDLATTGRITNSRSDHATACQAQVALHAHCAQLERQYPNAPSLLGRSPHRRPARCHAGSGLPTRLHPGAGPAQGHPGFKRRLVPRQRHRVWHRHQRPGPRLPQKHHGGARDGQRHAWRAPDWHSLLHPVPIRAGLLHRPGAGLQPLLRTSGLLSRSNKFMYDRTTWSAVDTFTGRAISGPPHKAGITLPQTTVVISTWADWR
jgi:hypothetical protein